MRNLLFIIIITLLAGCSASGPRFESVAATPQGHGLIYIMRQSQAFASANCFDVELDGEVIACIKNGGYLVKAVRPGQHKLRFKKSFLEPGKAPIVEINIDEGEIKYYEWTMNLKSMFATNLFVSMSASRAIIEHSESSALSILKSLNES